MSLSLAISLNALADVAMIGGLAYVMSRASRLAPHMATVAAAPLGLPADVVVTGPERLALAA